VDYQINKNFFFQLLRWTRRRRSSTPASPAWSRTSAASWSVTRKAKTTNRSNASLNRSVSIEYWVLWVARYFFFYLFSFHNITGRPKSNYFGSSKLWTSRDQQAHLDEVWIQGVSWKWQSNILTKCPTWKRLRWKICLRLQIPSLAEFNFFHNY